jgi:hypothetical protein
MTFSATSTVGSEIEIDISSTLTPIPGTQNIEITGVENGSFATGGIADAVDGNKGTGVSRPGSLKFSMLYDPADAVHKNMESRHNLGGVSIPVVVKCSSTGQTKAATCTSKKFDVKGEKNSGWIADVEYECEDVWVIVDPA